MTAPWRRPRVKLVALQAAIIAGLVAIAAAMSPGAALAITGLWLTDDRFVPALGSEEGSSDRPVP